jgi:hypothetical protein
MISCYFGKWPPYFHTYLKSCHHNPEIDFYFFTDCSSNDLPGADNVKFIPITLAEVRELASDKLGFPVSLQNPYKLCDFKPAYGKIFEDHLRGFDFWGHTDIDIILGNVGRFITDDLLAENDIISVREEYLSGFFALYRNTELVNTLFTRSPDYRKVYQSEKHYCFDECNFVFLHLLHGKSIWQKETEIFSMTHVIQSPEQAGLIRAHFRTYVEEWITKDLIWEHGRLSEAGSGEELLLVHLIHAAKTIDFVLPQWKNVPDSFRISKKGFFRSQQRSRGYRFEQKRQQYIIAGRRLRQKLILKLGPVLGRVLHSDQQAYVGEYCFGSFTVMVEQRQGQLHCRSDFFLTPLTLLPGLGRTFTSDLFEIIFRFRLRADGNGNLQFHQRGRIYSGYRL